MKLELTPIRFFHGFDVGFRKNGKCYLKANNRVCYEEETIIMTMVIEFRRDSHHFLPRRLIEEKVYSIRNNHET